MFQPLPIPGGIRWFPVVLLLNGVGCAAQLGAQTAAGDQRPHSLPPNIVMIAIDDLNDWVEPLEGHPDAKTPAIAALANRGLSFRNAHCQAPLCNPSRTSLLTGRRPSSTGIYGLAPWFRDVAELASLVTLPQYFQRHGYRTLIGGKVFHGAYGRPQPSEALSPECDVWGPPTRIKARPAQKLIPPTPGGNHPLMDWGTFPHRDQDQGDWEVASWAVSQLRSLPADQPFLLSVGFFLPHVPCYAPPRWFELYPQASLRLPEIIDGDRSDTPPSSWYIHWRLPEPRTSWLRSTAQLLPAVRAYLACISFVDSQVGRVLAAVAERQDAANTVIVLWSDHGFHLGEKGLFGKNSLWSEATRVPLLLAGPQIVAGGRCDEAVELLDLYPTLIDLAGLPPDPDLEGLSLLPQLADPNTARERPAICTHNPGNHAVCDERWRYIRYADGAEELYDRQQDPLEADNLLWVAPVHGGDPVQSQHRREADRLARWLPEADLPPAPGSAHRILIRRESGFYWEGERIDPAARIE